MGAIQKCLHVLPLLAFILAPLLNAQIISPSAVEIEYSYKTTFKPDVTDGRFTTASDHAVGNADHIFGILASKKIIKDVGVDPNQVGGLGAPRMPREVKVTHGNITSAEVEYEAKGRMILHRNAAVKWLKDGGVTLPMPYDMAKIYKKKCTDSTFYTLGDYWYFYDPYRAGCEELSQEPIAKNVFITMKAVKDAKLDESPRFDLLRGANGNGEDLVIYLMTGFNASSKDPHDAGRENDEASKEQLRAHHFTEESLNANELYPKSKFTKKITDPNGKKINLVVITQLAYTDAGSASVTFSKYFEEAVENADVFIYDGHSGLGGNLAFDTIEAKAGKKIKFRKGFRQLFFLNSCSSYSYYMDNFVSQKTDATIDVITTGLESDFDVSIKMHKTLVEEIIGYFEHPPAKPATWTQVLTKMEEPIPGGKGSYLLNVGGVKKHN